MKKLSLAFIVVFVAAIASAATSTLTPHDVARLRAVTDASISPDGSQIAFTLSVPRAAFTEDEGAAWGELHVIGTDGKGRPFVTGNVNISDVAWRPNRNAITFLAKRNGDEFKSLYEIGATGGEARRILKHTADISGYSWSPDGNRVAFFAKDPDSEEKKTIEKKGFRVEIFEESARPVKLWIADFSAASVTPRNLAIEGSGSLLRWSPNGSRILLAVAPTSLIDQEYTSRRVTIVDADGKAAPVLLANRGKLGDAQWSPSGDAIAVIGARNENDPAEGTLYLANPADGSVREILPKYAGHVNQVAWRNNSTLFVLGDEGVRTHLFELGRDGAKGKTIIAPGATVFTDIDVADNGRVALVGSSASHPAELFSVGATATQPVRLTDNNPWLKDERLAVQEVVRWKARDGLELEGILVRPLDEQRGVRYPLIMTVHGGPESHDRNGWVTGYSNPGQVGAAQGFAVFYPNYRGSTGRGYEFSILSQGDPAGKEFDDLVDAVDHLVATGLVDKAKVGITGGSYGGFATAWGATYYSERFAAAVMFVGISNIVAKWGTTDIPDEEFLVHARKRVYEDWNFFIQRSPVYWAHKSTTPTLILHGKDDPRVHPTQSMMLYRHLKYQGKAPVRLVYYPGEGHGNRRAGSRLDYNLRMMQWFDHYLKGPGGAPPPYDLDYNEAKEKQQ